MSSWCWPGREHSKGRVLSASKGWLRRFLLLKLVTVLLLPHTAGLSLLVGCVFSSRALLLLHSPHTSTKPSTVLLARLALADTLVLLHWMLQLALWMKEVCCGTKTGLVKEGDSAWRWEELGAFCEQLLDAHHLASLLLLGLLGLEATLVSRWPQQTVRFRTSHWAQLLGNLVWILVLLEILFSLHSKLLQDSRPQEYFLTPQTFQSSSLGLMPPSSLPDVSSYLRRILWLVNLWLHYAVLFGRPQKRNSFFH